MDAAAIGPSAAARMVADWSRAVPNVALARHKQPAHGFRGTGSSHRSETQRVRSHRTGRDVSPAGGRIADESTWTRMRTCRVAARHDANVLEAHWTRVDCNSAELAESLQSCSWSNGRHGNPFRIVHRSGWSKTTVGQVGCMPVAHVMRL